VEIPKPTDADKERFHDLVPADTRVEVKAMFGNLGAFVNGNMFAGLFGPAIGVKLGENDHQELTTRGGGPFGPAQRPMGGYLSLPAAVVDDPDEAAAWVQRALEHVGTSGEEAQDPESEPLTTTVEEPDA
jgi:TfoX/Sxy family transcriptional regulator of competence genes